MLLAIVAQFDLVLDLLDVKTTFLHGDLARGRYIYVYIILAWGP